jgi:DNA-binding CsgD family transcriptional regulator
MEIRTPYLDALAAQAKGAVSLGDGKAQAALSELRRSWRIWRDLDASYEAARVRVLIGIACRDMGDDESAEMEFDAAYWIFQQLGAGPVMKKVELLSGRMSAGNTHGLTPREMEVLRMVAAGKTNKGIASELFISERTVDRHVSNIFLKLDVESRTAAASYAFKHKLI